ncbi:MAG: sulfite exporter TauE/SafE family protein [Chitinophagaceae bacterium]
MEILAYLASILIGVSLGLIGSGGSILTVPVLVYLMGINPLLATTSSLFIVGTASLAGGIRSFTKNQVDLKAIVLFGIPSVLSIFFTRHYLLPAIPDIIFSFGNLAVPKDMFLMVLFAILMLASSFSMIKGRKAEIETGINKEYKVIPLVLLGLIIGVITGLLGAGGGFLIIPALILFLKLPMKKAVGTSLIIITINSLSGFLFSLNQFVYPWTIMLIFTAMSVAGIFVGSKLAEKFSGARLKKGFGWFVLIMGIYIILKELFIK